jgi:hypothetical protein
MSQLKYSIALPVSAHFFPLPLWERVDAMRSIADG